MSEAESRSQELRRRASAVRVRALETNKAIIAELTGIWQELNTLARADHTLREACDLIAHDIAQLEKLDLGLDVDWLAEAKRAHPESSA